MFNINEFLEFLDDLGRYKESKRLKKMKGYLTSDDYFGSADSGKSYKVTMNDEIPEDESQYYILSVPSTVCRPKIQINYNFFLFYCPFFSCINLLAFFLKI